MCYIPHYQNVDTSLDNVLVIIPVRNEESTIAAVIRDLQSFGLTKIRVVDNGSSDRSAEIAKDAGVEVLYESRSGYGQACWRGLQNMPSKINWILFRDGDDSDDLSCLPQFFGLQKQYDLILGDRRATAEGKAVMTPIQNFGNGLASWLIDLGWGYKYHDLGSLRLIRRSALEQIALQDRGFGWTVEMQVRAIEEGLNIIEIPVNYRPRQGGKSKISGTISGSIQAGIIILSTLGKLYLYKKLEVRSNSSKFLWLSVLCLLFGAIITAPYGDFRQPETVISFGWNIAVMGLGFIFSWQLKSLSLTWFWLVAIATRLILLAMYPGDDIWRYIWEGYIQNRGFSPYDFAPNAPELIPYRFQWGSQINHQSVSAIYPPLTQLGFRALAAMSPSVILFKSSFAIADLLICWLLTKKLSYLDTTFYAWNPLLIYSFAGGGHYDSWFILPLVAAWVLLSSKKKLTFLPLLMSSLLVGISIAIKWISLPILGFLCWSSGRKIGLKTSIIIAICGILPLCVTALAFCSADTCSLVPTSSTFVSHGRSAEFLPYLLAKVWYPPVESNSIFAFPLGIITIFLFWKARNFQQFALSFLASLLIISPIVHSSRLVFHLDNSLCCRHKKLGSTPS